MSELIPFNDWQKELADAFKAIQQPRTDFQIEHFVVGQHVTEVRRWHQCVLELQIKFQNFRRGKLSEEKLLSKIKKKEAAGKIRRAEELRIDLEDLQLAMLGAVNELKCLWAIYKSFPRAFTREEINAAEAEYWQKRLTMQARHDLESDGRIAIGNRDALRMAGIDPASIAGRIEAVEQKFLSQGNVRILVAVPTLIPRETIDRDGLECLKGWELPGTIERKLFVVQGKPIADAYNVAAQQAIDDGADYILCVEDDHLIPQGTFEKLWAIHRENGPRSIAGAWYPQRSNPRTGTPIILFGDRRECLEDTGDVHLVYGIPQGFTLIPTQAFRDIPQPWFVTTPALTQDSYFSQQAREAGYKLLVDTSARIKHVCRETGRVYE